MCKTTQDLDFVSTEHTYEMLQTREKKSPGRNNRLDSKSVKTYLSPHNITSKGKSIKEKRFLCHYHTSKDIAHVDSTSGLRNPLAAFTKLFLMQ